MEDIFNSVLISPPWASPRSTSTSSGLTGPTGSVSAAQLRDASLVRGMSTIWSNQDTTQLLERRHAGRHLGQTVVPERPHPLPDGLALEVLTARARNGQRLELLAHHHQLEDSDPALVAGMATARAAALAVEGGPVGGGGDLGRDAVAEQLVDRRAVHLAALRAELARQALREHGRDRRPCEERLDAHLVEARDRAGGVVR